MKKKFALLLTAVIAATTLFACGGKPVEEKKVETDVVEKAEKNGEAEDEKSEVEPELKLIIASNQTSEENPYSYGLDKFKEVAEDESGGKIQVIVHKGTLGENESELVEKLQMGAADMVVASPGFMTQIGVPEVDMFSLLYLFDSFDHWAKCLDGEFGESMKSIVKEKTGNQFYIAGYWSSSVRDVYAKKAVKSPEDVKGLKIRTQSSQVQQDFWKECGAIPTSVAWGELYQALQQGVVDAAENDYTNLMLKEHHKTPNGKYISETHHDFTTRLFLMDGNKYDALSDEMRKWIDDASKAATEEERKITFKMYDESKQKCIEDGAIITEFDDINIPAFRDIAIPIQDKFANENHMEEQLKMIRDAQ